MENSLKTAGTIGFSGVTFFSNCMFDKTRHPVVICFMNNSERFRFGEIVVAEDLRYRQAHIKRGLPTPSLSRMHPREMILRVAHFRFLFLSHLDFTGCD